jgi:hypothetical protein
MLYLGIYGGQDVMFSVTQSISKNAESNQTYLKNAHEVFKHKENTPKNLNCHSLLRRQATLNRAFLGKFLAKIKMYLVFNISLLYRQERMSKISSSTTVPFFKEKVNFHFYNSVSRKAGKN